MGSLRISAYLLLAAFIGGSAVGAPGPFADIKDFGATGDGKNDDTAAIQRAIDSVSAGGGVVLLPVGVYLVTPTPGSSCNFLGCDDAAYGLNLPSDVTLRGAGPGATVLRLELAAGRCVAIHVPGRRSRVESLAVIADRRPPDIGTLWGVVLNSAEKVTVEDCRFETLSVGVLVSRAKTCHVRASEMKDCQGNGVVMYGSKWCRIQSCVVDSCGDGNCTLYGANDQCHITECTLLNADQCGVIESSRDCSIRNCSVDGGERGIMGLIVNRSVRATIAGNTVRNVHHGLFVRETDVAGAGGIPNIATRITGNTISGIRNRISGNPQAPLFVSFGFATIISGNVFHDNICPAEIRIVGTTMNNSQANCVVSGNAFALVTAEYGEGFFADSHPCVVANVGVTVADNTITSYGARPVKGISDYLIDVGAASIVRGNRNSGLRGRDMPGGADRFIRIRSDSIVSGNYSSWEVLGGPVIQIIGDDCIVTGNRLTGPTQAGISLIGPGQGTSSVIRDNILPGPRPHQNAGN